MTTYTHSTASRFGVLHPAIEDARTWLRENLPADIAEKKIRLCDGMPPEHWRSVVGSIQSAMGANALRIQRDAARRALLTSGGEPPASGSCVSESSCAAGEAVVLPSSLASGVDGQESATRASYLLVDTNPVPPSEPSELDPTSDTIEDRCERYTKLRLQTIRQADYVGCIHPSTEEAAGRDTRDIASNLHRCGSYLVFRRYDAINENRLQAGMFCQCGRLCAFCSMRRMVRAVQRLVPLVFQAIKETETTAYLWTPTVKNGPDLLERLDVFRLADRQLHQRGKNYRKHLEGKKRAAKYTEWHKVIGQLWAIEIKKGSGSGLWHPHQHSIVLCTDEPDADALSEEWKELTNGSHRVDVRELYAMQAIRDGASCEEVRDQLTQDLLEVISYSLKFSTMSPAETWEAYIACNGYNLMGRRGVLYGAKVADEYLDAPIELDDLPYVESVARWVEDHYDIEHADHWPSMAGGAE